MDPSPRIALPGLRRADLVAHRLIFCEYHIDSQLYPPRFSYRLPRTETSASTSEPSLNPIRRASSGVYPASGAPPPGSLQLNLHPNAFPHRSPSRLAAAMDSSIQRSLNDKLYDRRKLGALEYVHFTSSVRIFTQPARRAGTPPQAEMHNHNKMSEMFLRSLQYICNMFRLTPKEQANIDTFPVSLEKTVRECLAIGDHERVSKIIDQLCQDYAYSVHQPHARNGGLIGLAAASIALGPVGV